MARKPILFSKKTARNILTELKHQDKPKETEVDDLYHAAKKVLISQASRRQSIAARVLTTVVTGSIYFALCLVSSCGEPGKPMTTSLRDGLSPTNHPWITTAIGVGLALFITAGWFMTETERSDPDSYRDY